MLRNYSGCIDDEYCKNLNLYKSSFGKFVYRCPNSTCTAGGCQCEPKCRRDTVTGVCVPLVEEPLTTNGPIISGTPTVDPTYPITPPPKGKCISSQIGDDRYVCWKREEIGDMVYIVDCNPNECNMGSLTRIGTENLAGSLVSIYATKPLSSEDLTGTDKAIIIGVSCGVGSLVLILGLYFYFKNHRR